MGLLAEYELRYDRLPLVDAAVADPTVTLDLEVGQPNGSGPPSIIVRATGDEFVALERFFETSDFVDRWSFVGEFEGTRRYRLHPTRGRVEQLDIDNSERFGSFADTRTVVERITVTQDGWIQKRWFADRKAFDEYRALWRSEGASFSLRRLRTDGEWPNPTADATEAAALTDAQREAIHAGRDLGYFDVPRRATLEDVAAELGVSAPACSERLRRAQAALVESALADGPRKKLLPL